MMNSSLAFPRSLILLLIYLLSQLSTFLAVSCLSYVYYPSYLLSQPSVVSATCAVPAICFPSHQLSQPRVLSQPSAFPAICFPSHQLSQPYVRSLSCAPSHTLCLQQLQSLGLMLQKEISRRQCLGYNIAIIGTISYYLG